VVRAIVALGLLGGCSIYDPSLLLPAPDAGYDATTSDAGGADADPCPHAFPPPRPAADDPSGSNEIELVQAVQSLVITQALDGGALPDMGFDIDGVCTCPGPESCTPAVTGAQHCDDPQGRDNSGGEQLAQFTLVSNGLFDQGIINQHIGSGLYTVLLRVRHYNGKPNDTSVEASLYTSNGTPTDDAGHNEPPRWDGSDQWTVDTASVFGGLNDAGAIIPNYVDPNAYVSGGVLVASLDFALALGSSDVVVMDLAAVVLGAPLVGNGGSFRVDQGLLAGRWQASKLLRSAHAVHDPLHPGHYVCPGSATYQNAKQIVCRGADVPVDPKNDRTAAPCDALSVVMGFTSFPAAIGAITEKPPQVDACDAGPDDCTMQ
jgi:hypothetical protein